MIQRLLGISQLERRDIKNYALCSHHFEFSTLKIAYMHIGSVFPIYFILALLIKHMCLFEKHIFPYYHKL